MRGEPEAEFRALYDRFSLSVYRRALRILGNSNDAWDAVQEVFIRVFRHWSDFRGEAHPMTYLYRVATNVCITHIHRRAGCANPPELLQMELAPDAALQAEARQMLYMLATKLDERKLTIAALYYLDELSQEKIAEVVGLSRKTVGLELAEVRRIAGALAARFEVGRG